MSGLLVSWTTTSAASTAAAAEAEGDAAEEQVQHALRAAVEDARADEEWRQLLQQQARREEEAEEEALRERLARRGTTRAPVPAPAPATVKSVRHDDEPDGQGWTPLEQRALEAAMRAHPACAGVAPADRWRGIAALVPGRSARECVQRCRTLAAAVRASALAPAPSVAPPIPSAALLRLDGDVLFGVLARVDGRALCACACACRELGAAAHDDTLWLPIADALPSKWAYSRRDRGGEAVWSYCLRMRTGLYGAWRKLNLHRAGECPYLRKLGTVDRGTFVPAGALDYKLAYGAVCELVQLESKREGGLSHRTYKAVAEQLVSYSANARSATPPDLHMTVREIYKTVYPGYGAATGSGAFAPGLQAGGSSTKASTSGAMLGKGVATMIRKVQDEELRARLETRHEFQILIRH